MYIPDAQRLWAVFGAELFGTGLKSGSGLRPRESSHHGVLRLSVQRCRGQLLSSV